MNSNEFSVLRKFGGDVQHQCDTWTAHRGLGGNCMCGEDAGQRWLEPDHPGTSVLLLFEVSGAQPPAVCWGGARAAGSHCGLCPLAAGVQWFLWMGCCSCTPSL